MSDKEKSEQPSKGKWHGGKGSARKQSDEKKYADGWERIFGKGKNNKSNNNS